MNKTLKKASAPSAALRLGQYLSDRYQAGASTNVLFAYEDSPTRQWARQIYEQVNPLVRASVRPTWWRMAEFREAGVLAGAVSTAIRADVVVVAARGAESLPLPFYFWVESWLPHRHAASGLLIGLLGAPQPPIPPAGRVRTYLRALAEEGHMAFALEERELVDDVIDLNSLVRRELLRQ